MKQHSGSSLGPAWFRSWRRLFLLAAFPLLCLSCTFFWSSPLFDRKLLCPNPPLQLLLHPQQPDPALPVPDSDVPEPDSYVPVTDSDVPVADSEDIPATAATGRVSRPVGNFTYKTCRFCNRGHGVCNLELGRCDCSFFVGGQDCLAPNMPSCQLTPLYHTRCQNTPSTCACMLECERQGLSRPPFCFTAEPPYTDLASIYASPQILIHTDLRGGGIRLEEPSEPLPWKPVPLEECPGSCSFQGWCSVGGEGESPFCNCPPGLCGLACERACERGDFALQCFNGCSGRGTCERGFCHCSSGNWGIDCSLSAPPSGQGPPSIWLGPSTPAPWSTRPTSPSTSTSTSTSTSASASVSAAASAALPASLRVYVYDLPPRFNQWMYAHGIHMERHEPMVFLERVLHSPLRTTDPEDADFFLLPIFPRWHPHVYIIIEDAVNYIRETWPYWDRTGGAHHLLFSTPDRGACETGGNGRRHPLLQNATILSMWGHMGWEEYDLEKLPCHRKGLDIVIPPKVYEKAVLKSPWLRVLGSELSLESVLGERRKTLFYFSGSGGITPGRNGYGLPNYSFGVRQKIFGLFADKTKYPFIHLHDTDYGPDWVAEMLQATFCLAPSGYGWGIRTSQAVLMGCVPVIIQPNVIQPFEDEGIVDWDSVAVRIDNLEDIPKLPEILRSLAEDVVDGVPGGGLLAKRARMAKEWTRMVWLSPSANPLQQDEYPEISPILAEKVLPLIQEADAFDGVIRTLGQRLAKRKVAQSLVG